MRIVIAPDKFKGTASASEAAAAIAAGIARVLPAAQLVQLPVADGGEGTLEAAIVAGGQARETPVHGPLGDPVRAAWAMRGTTAVIESARASGLALVEPTPATAIAAHSEGVGELILAALDQGATEIIVGLGGSAMTDGGSGALRALGARITESSGAPVAPGGAALARARNLDLSGLDSRLARVQLRLAVDVDNPLTGAAGAAAVFAPQKGADAAAVEQLDAALTVWARLLEAATGTAITAPGAGAAGGFPAAFLGLPGVSLEPGSALVADLLGLDEALSGADLLIVGEGSLDAQSLGGKAPIAAARRAGAQSIAVAAIAGVIEVSATELAAAGITQAIALVDLAPSVEQARTETAHWLEEAGALLALSLP